VNTDTFRIVLTDFGQAQRLPEPSLQYPAGEVSWFSRRGKGYYYAPEYFVTPAPAILNAIKVDTWQLVSISVLMHLNLSMLTTLFLLGCTDVDFIERKSTIPK
jgi:hypothetical protein